MSIAILAEHLSKEYILGVINHGMLYKDIQSWIARKFGKPDPHMKIGVDHFSDFKDRFWALKDICFEVNEGERIGIIGRNGAGKSTLLKILSRVTAPTEGTMKIKGRIASLLEVGTGFHPELTGRENVYLNGAILGMKTKEITKKMDEIIAFSEIEQFIDTPVKRYSSGMYVRLAFSVAAHLESEILVTDEVLAVGDVAFQEKCLGKMKDVSRESGRTVLLVSHNADAIRTLCDKSIHLEKGSLVRFGMTEDVLSEYLRSTRYKEALGDTKFEGPLSQSVTIHEISVNDEASNISLDPSSQIEFKIRGYSAAEISAFRLTLSISQNNVRICSMQDCSHGIPLKKGEFTSRFVVPPYLLRPGIYKIAVGGLTEGLSNEWFWGTNLLELEIKEVWSSRNEKVNLGLINVHHSFHREQGGKVVCD